MQNRLYYGDNLDILRKKVRDESIDLCYIDPPFNSKRTYNQIYTNVGKEDLAQAQAFTDTWVWDDRAKEGYSQIISNHEGRFTGQTIELITGLRNVLKEGSLLAYLVSMTLRVVEIQRVLKPTGSFYLHCDPTSSHYLKLVLDSIFCPRGGDFINEVIWKRNSAHSGASGWGPVHDVIFLYRKSDTFTWNPVYQAYDKGYLETKYKQSDGKGPYRLSDLTGAGWTSGDSGKDWRGFSVKSIGRHWAVSKDRLIEIVGAQKAARLTTQEKLDVLDAHGYIYWTPRGKRGGKGFPQFKRHLPSGVPIQDVVTDVFPVNSQAKERLGYPTQKPIELLERMIRASSNEGDVVLDCYCGCGTTVAAAQALNRHWIGMDITYQSISLILKRLTKDFGSTVAQSVILDGAPRDMESAVALAHKRDDRSRKEFEKWAILTYTNNCGVINEKKGGDRGIDGVAYILIDASAAEKMLLQVKSGATGRGDIAKLRGDMDREQARMGTLITLEEPTKGMITEAKSAGQYTHPLTGKVVDRIRVVTVKQIVEDKLTLDLPISLDALWKAKEDAKGNQLSLFVPVNESSPRKPVQSEVPVKKSKARSGA